MADGVIDLNTAAVVPATGATTVEIDGRPQRVLSTTQILRGKLERAPRPAPVRDVYDMIRAAQDPTARENLIVAYALLTTEERDRIESTWVELDAHYEAEAGESLRLTEAPCTDLSMLGSTGARTLNDHRLARVVIETQPEMVLIERRTRNGRTIENTVEPAGAAEKLRNLGTADHIQEHGGTIRRISKAIETAGRRGLSGIVFDTADDRPADRLDGRDTSRKRHHGPKPAGRGGENGGSRPKDRPGREWTRAGHLVRLRRNAAGASESRPPENKASTGLKPAVEVFPSAPVNGDCLRMRPLLVEPEPARAGAPRRQLDRGELVDVGRRTSRVRSATWPASYGCRHRRQGESDRPITGRSVNRDRPHPRSPAASPTPGADPKLADAVTAAVREAAVAADPRDPRTLRRAAAAGSTTRAPKLTTAALSDPPG